MDGLHDVKPIDDIQYFAHGVKVSSIYIVSRGLVWYEGRIVCQMKMYAYMITISQAWEIINVINHIVNTRSSKLGVVPRLKRVDSCMC